MSVFKSPKASKQVIYVYFRFFEQKELAYPVQVKSKTQKSQMVKNSIDFLCLTLSALTVLHCFSLMHIALHNCLIAQIWSTC